MEHNDLAAASATRNQTNITEMRGRGFSVSRSQTRRRDRAWIDFIKTDLLFLPSDGTSHLFLTLKDVEVFYLSCKLRLFSPWLRVFVLGPDLRIWLPSHSLVRVRLLLSLWPCSATSTQTTSGLRWVAWTQYGASTRWKRLTAFSNLFWCLQCLCISPTYELALQIGQVTEQMGKFCPDVKLAYGIRGNRSKSLFTSTLSLNGMTGKRDWKLMATTNRWLLYGCMNLFFSGQRRPTAGANCDRNAGHDPRLVHQVQADRPQEDHYVCLGRGRCHDRHAGTPGPEHTHPSVSTAET